MDGIRGILFDNDGTLVDTRALIMESFAFATKKLLGRAVTEAEVIATGGAPLVQQMRSFTDDPQLADELVRVYREHNHAVHDERVALFDGVLDGLAGLHAAGLRMGVVTSKMHWLAWHGLELTGAARYLDCCIGADDCPRHKPDPLPIAYGAEALGLDPRECVYAGDSPFDIRAGNAAGCTTMAALWGMFDEEELRKEKPDRECRNFTELVQAIL